MSSTVTAREVITSLIDAGQTVATCESLTAGLLAATLADVPGASAALRGGLVTYATDLKHTLARVPQEVLVAHGPVARETAIAMARGVRDVCGADWGVSLTGVAGPDPQDGHPVGEVWVAPARRALGWCILGWPNWPEPFSDRQTYWWVIGPQSGARR